jgi:aspartate dehydrogenase
LIVIHNNAGFHHYGEAGQAQCLTDETGNLFIMMRIGLLGCGNIGHIIAEHATGFTITAVYDVVPERAQEIARISGGQAYGDFASFLNADIDIVVEAASVVAVWMHAQDVLSHHKNIIIMSVGALADPAFRDQIRKAALASGTKVFIPSGAIFGLDNLKVGRISKISRLLLRTTKSPASLNMDAKERRLIFSGKANECIKAFPKNVNVSVAMSLAAGQDTDVELWVDPAIDRNVHELFIEGDFGEAHIQVTNVPSPDNQATSYLAALSILSLLEKMDDPIVVGT